MLDGARFGGDSELKKAHGIPLDEQPGSNLIPDVHGLF